MIEQIFFTDKSFDSNNINDYHLSLQINLKGFSFCILDRTNNKFISLGNYYYDKISSYRILIEEIKYIFTNTEILNLNYQHVKLLVTTPKFTLIPSPFYSNEKRDSIFTLNHKKRKNEIILSNFLYGNSSYVLYSLPEYIKTFFDSKFNNIKYYHQSCPLIEEILLKDKLSTEQQKVFINISPALIDIVVINDNKLLLYNSFAYSNDTDFHYFILNTLDQLKISPINTPVYISGYVKPEDKKIEHLKKYVKRISYFDKPGHFEYSYDFNTIPDYYFTNLLNLYQCG